MLSYDAIALQIDAYLRALSEPNPHAIRIASWLPLYHDMGLIACFLLPLYAGAQVISMDAFEWTAAPVRLFELVEAYGATHVWLPNFAFNHMVRGTPRSRRFDLSSVRAFINCSESCKAETFDRFADRFGPDGVSSDRLLTCYAMAETVFAVAQSPPGSGPLRLEVDSAALWREGVARPPGAAGVAVTLLSCGNVVDGLAVSVLREGRPVGDRSIGELAVRGDFLFSGYFMDPETTSAALVDGWYSTGDLGFTLDGQVFVTGRLKEVIIINGRNFYAHDFETVLNTAPGIAPGQVAVFGSYSPTLGSEQLVVVAERSGPQADDPRVVAEVSSKIASVFGIVPSDVCLRPRNWLVKTTSGKISRSENINKYQQDLCHEQQ